MMRFVNAVISNMKIITHQPAKILNFFMMPLFVMFIINMATSGNIQKNTVVHFISDNSKLINEIKENKIADIAINSEERVISKLKDGKITNAYFIPDKFEELLIKGENPKIIIKSNLKDGRDERIDRFLNNYKNKIIIAKNLEKNGIVSVNSIMPDALISIRDNERLIDSNYFMAILMIMIFIMMNSNQLITELLNLKKNNVLKRMITTPNTDFFHIFSIITANLIIMIVLNILAITISSVFMNFTISSYPILIAMISCMCFVSISLSLAVFRLVKYQIFASTIPIIVSVGSAFMVMFYELKRFEIPIAEFIGKLSPYYWGIEILDKNSMFPGVFVLLLMGFVFLTAGSFKLREYALEQ